MDLQGGMDSLGTVPVVTLNGDKMVLGLIYLGLEYAANQRFVLLLFEHP